MKTHLVKLQNIFVIIDEPRPQLPYSYPRRSFDLLCPYPVHIFLFWEDPAIQACAPWINIFNISLSWPCDWSHHPHIRGSTTFEPSPNTLQNQLAIFKTTPHHPITQYHHHQSCNRTDPWILLVDQCSLSLRVNHKIFFNLLFLTLIVLPVQK